jgi:CBS domain-containing protein
MEEKSSLISELVSDTVLLDYKTPVTKVMPLLEKYEAVVITRNGEYTGIIDSRSLSRQKGLNLKNSNALKYAEKTPQINDSTSIDDLIYYFYKTRRKALPYVRNGKIRGVLTRMTLLKILLSLQVLKGMKAEESMSSPVIAINSGASLSQAKAAMRENKVNRLLVIDEGRFMGLLTNHDLSLKYSVTGERLPEMKTKKYSPSNIRIMEVVERNPVTIDASSDLAEAARQMVERSISSVLVQSGGKPVGMLTVFDILESLVAKRQISERKVFISGLDNYTYEYEDDLRETLNTFVNKLEKMKNIKVNYITLHIKRIKTKSYELQARLSIDKYGTITMHIYGEKLDRALASLLSTLKNKVIKYKEKRIIFSKSAPVSDDEIAA